MKNKHGFLCECGREFSKPQSLYAHQGHCKIHLGTRYDPILHGDRFGEKRAWSKGKTKYNDPRIAAISEKMKGKEGSFKGHHHSEEFKRKQAKTAKYNAQNHLNGWKAGNSKNPNKYEKFTEKILISNGINYQREVTVPQSILGKKGSYYQLDFLIDGYIDLEIDGSSHKELHDSVRDKYVSKLYKVYRIKHNDSIEQLEKELNKFISSL